MTYNVFSGTLNPTHFTSLQCWVNCIGRLALFINSHHTSVAGLHRCRCLYCCAAVEKEFNWCSTSHNPSTTAELFVMFVIDISFMEFKITSPKRCTGVTWNDVEILSSSVALFCFRVPVALQQSLAFCFQIHRLDAEPTAQSLQTHGKETIRTAAAAKQGTVIVQHKCLLLC